MSQKALQKIVETYQDFILGTHDQHGDETVIVMRDALPDLFHFLKYDPDLAFDMLLDVTAVDCVKMRNEPDGLPEGHRFFVVYHFRSLGLRQRIRIKVPLSEDDPVIPTACGVWKGANWPEREAYDMFGIVFKGHPDLRRILLYDEFQGYPLRKDYPLRGYQPRIPMPTLKGDPVPGLEDSK